jgi:MIP family channel proteins
MDIKAALAEFIGTFTLVFIGAGAGALAAISGGGIVGVALAHGVALLVIIYAWGSISGAHVNPAVTFGVLVAGRMDIAKAIAYWVAQFVGAAAAAYLLLWLLQPSVTDLGATIGSLTPTPTNPGDPVKVVVLEGVLTFFLVIAVFASGIHGRNGNMAGIAIGLVLTMDILMGGALTGASMNPARTFGPALAMNDFSYLWMYLVGPMVGGAVAALLYDRMFLPSELKPPIEAARSPGNSRR